MDKPGLIPIDIIRAAWEGGFTTKSDLARTRADEVAVCACKGFITTQVNSKEFGSVWRPTPAGLRELFIYEGILDE